MLYGLVWAVCSKSKIWKTWKNGIQAENALSKCVQITEFSVVDSRVLYALCQDCENVRMFEKG